MSVQGFSSGGVGRGLQVFRADDFRVSNGANLGDPVAHAAEVMLGDIYQLVPTARAWHITLAPADEASHFRIDPASQTGRPDAEVHLDCCATFMAPDGTTVDALIVIELQPGAHLVAATYLLPLAQLQPRVDYALIAIDADAARERLAQMACISFVRGTRITMADGRQTPIESLRPGDIVLTRDGGPQPVRWIGQQTLRATGAFAPVVFAPGAIHNEDELHLAPDQRLFFYQREDRLKAGRAEVMVRARLLVNGETVRRGGGGFVDYFQLLFDRHQFIYAEGIAAESLFFDQSVAAVPGNERRAIEGKQGPLDLPEGLLEPGIAAATLCGVSTA